MVSIYWRYNAIVPKSMNTTDITLHRRMQRLSLYFVKNLNFTSVREQHIDGVWEDGAEGNIWTREREINRRMGKIT
jgi:hypothetical protein